MNFARKSNMYLLFAMMYPAIRKPFILKDHYVETNDSTYTNKTYRPLLWCEIFLSSFVCGFSGMITTPLFIGKDVWNIENNIRKIEQNDKNKYHQNFLEVLKA